MGKIYEGVEELIGRTPILRLNRFAQQYQAGAQLYAKLEAFNPGGSAKDRVAWEMVRDAQEKGFLKPGSVIIEPTSGNTGVGLAAMAAAKGYRAVIVMPDTMSVERRSLIKAYGAELVLTDGAKGMAGAVEKAEELHRENPDSIIAGQFVNPANPSAHYKTTGPEIWEDMDGDVDIYVACVGTGGTLSGAGKFLKEKNPHIRVVAVEPSDSPLLSKGYAGPHKIQGIGSNFIPDTLDQSVYDEVLAVEAEDAFQAGRDMARYEGMLVGISSGAALTAAVQLSRRPENAGKKIVVLLPDTGERYLSTEMFAEA